MEALCQQPTNPTFNSESGSVRLHIIGQPNLQSNILASLITDSLNFPCVISTAGQYRNTLAKLSDRCLILIDCNSITYDTAADILDFLQKLNAEKPVVFCGDLNVAHTEKDIKNAKSNYNKSPGYTQTEIDGLTKFIDSGFIDSWRHFNPEEIKYSWWSYRFNSRAKNTGWRIDYFLTSEKLLPRVNNTEIHNDIYGSDHCPVSIELN